MLNYWNIMGEAEQQHRICGNDTFRINKITNIKS